MCPHADVPLHRRERELDVPVVVLEAAELRPVPVDEILAHSEHRHHFIDIQQTVRRRRSLDRTCETASYRRIDVCTPILALLAKIDERGDGQPVEYVALQQRQRWNGHERCRWLAHGVGHGCRCGQRRCNAVTSLSRLDAEPAMSCWAMLSVLHPEPRPRS